jgi:hypothetical protein
MAAIAPPYVVAELSRKMQLSIRGSVQSQHWTAEPNSVLPPVIVIPCRPRVAYCFQPSVE